MNSLEQVTCSCGHIFTLTVKTDIEKNESTVDVKKHKFSSRTNAFSVTNQQTSFIAQGCLRVAALEICLDKRTGLYTLNTLLISYSSFTICNIDSASKFKTVAKYHLSNTADDFESVRKLFLFESKAVCFNLGEDQIVVLYDGSVRTYSTEVHFIVLDCKAVKDFLVLICKTGENKVSLVTLYTSLSSHEKLHKCDSRLIPDFYASVLTFVKIVNLDLAVDAASLEPQFTGSALACTSYGQLIECRGGQLCSCTALPFSDGCDIRCVNSSSDQFARSLIVVLSGARSCCVVDLKASQVVFVLEDVESVLVDDFVGSGADQILFLPRETRHQSNIDVVSMVDEANDRDLNSGFLLTDLAGTHIDKWTSAQDYKEPSKSKPSASRQAAVEALDSRRLAGRAMVNEARHSCLRKLTVVEETAEALRKMTLGETLSHRSRNTLVPLLGSKMIGNQPTELPLLTRVAEVESVTTGALFQRIVDRKLVIGVQVHNATNSSIHSIELVLFNSASVADELKTTSRCLHIAPSPFADAHPVKRSRTEPSNCEQYISSTIVEEMETIPTKGNGYVLVFCDLPLFQPEESVTFKVMLAWRKKDGSGNTSHPRMICLSKVVGEVSVDVENIVKGMWNASFGVETKSGDMKKDAVVMATDSAADLLSLHCIQTGLRLTMSSAEIAFPRRLLMSLQSPLLGFSYIDRHESFVCLSHSHPLFLARLRILRIRYDDLVVEVFVRDPTQWTILIQSLFKVLPNDVTVALDTTGCVVRLVESVVLALRQELLVTVDREPAALFADNRETDQSRGDVADGWIDDVRSDFESRRRKFVDRVLVDDNQNEGYPLKVIELKQNTDRLMMSLAQVVGHIS